MTSIPDHTVPVPALENNIMRLLKCMKFKTIFESIHWKEEKKQYLNRKNYVVSKLSKRAISLKNGFF